jgi:G6PDH family F420-dependent oxidoreductase
MTRFGYFLSCEEYAPDELLEQARLAERAGFDSLWISDHFHPWTNAQGQSPFVWSMIGAVAQVCDLPVTTAVTCPTVRTHPAIVAQAAATSAVLLGEGRFTLGVGTGEALNEHVLGDVWPHAERRLEMLEEAVEVIRELWTGEVVSRHGRHYTVDTARIYTLPDEPPPIYMSAFGPKALDVACRIADGFVTTQPDAESVETFRAAKGADAPTQASRSPGAPRATRRSTPRTSCGPTPACPASSRRCCRARSTSSRPASWSRARPSPRRVPSALTSPSTSRPTRRSSTRASARCTSPTWARTTPT